MTEKRGGSDVGSATDTVSVRQPDGSYKLYGFKWFTSAIDADMTLSLARTTDQVNQTTISGSKGLNLFYSEVQDE